MILTVTINPLLERKFTYNKIDLISENRNGTSKLNAGGKGINVSRQLNSLNVDNFALTFLGGLNGKMLKEILMRENIKNVSIHTKDETRDAVVIIDETDKKHFTFFRADSNITSQEVNEFLEKMKKMIDNCEMVIFSGSSPCEEADSIFPAGISYANSIDKISVCDTYGNHLKSCIESSPTVLHNNVDEVEKSLNISLNSEKDKTDFLSYLYQKGIKQSFLTDGEKSFFASNFDYQFKIDVPQIEAVNSTGSGDSFVAGIAYSWHHSLTFEESLALSTALGIANALHEDVCNIKLDEIEKFKSEIKISSFGKKMKKLDVTPS